jgi:hypothetical protein
VTVTPGPGYVNVHFPGISGDFASSFPIAKPYGGTSNVDCSVVYGSEPGGSVVQVSCRAFVSGIPLAPAGTQFMVGFSTTLAIFC